MQDHDSRRLADSLAARVVPDADASHIADGMVAIWQEIEVVLIPVIGRGGLAALYGRGLHLASPAHPWLEVTREPVRLVMDFVALRSVVVQQGNAQARAGCVAFLQIFHELLDSLIGSFLTEQLLGPVWAYSLGNVLE
jgi:hypothetical protein